MLASKAAAQKQGEARGRGLGRSFIGAPWRGVHAED
jgi:hypothetical protein